MEHTKEKENSYFGNFFHNMTHNLNEFMGDSHFENEGDHQQGRDFPMLVKMADAMTESIEGCFVSVPGCTREAGDTDHHNKDDQLFGHRWTNDMTAVLLMSFMPIETPIEFPRTEHVEREKKQTKSTEKGLIWKVLHPIKSLNELHDTNRGIRTPPTHDVNYIVPPV